MILYYPVDAFYRIKQNRARTGWLPGMFMVLVAFVIRVFQLYATHFPLMSIYPRDANIFAEAVKLCVPIFTWSYAVYAVTAIMDGECLSGELFTATSFSLIPYIVLTGPLTLLSRLMTREELGLFIFLRSAPWIWVVALLFLSVMVMNNFSLGKTIIICLLSVVSMMLIWMVILLFMILTGQLLDFFGGIAVELRMILLAR